MTNPPYILEHLEEMAKILSHPRVYSFLHIPVQAASDKVLRDMRREYTCAEFKRVVEFLRERVPGLTIATDIICGFPTETAEDFEETLALVRQYQFPVLFINQFYPRPGTPAAKMPRVPTNEVCLCTCHCSLYHFVCLSPLFLSNI
jgi:threonylcarbamoyladenosine tRNA methylthiotransferase CDKAL1